MQTWPTRPAPRNGVANAGWAPSRERTPKTTLIGGTRCAARRVAAAMASKGSGAQASSGVLQSKARSKSTARARGRRGIDEFGMTAPPGLPVATPLAAERPLRVGIDGGDHDVRLAGSRSEREEGALHAGVQLQVVERTAPGTQRRHDRKCRDEQCRAPGAGHPREQSIALGAKLAAQPPEHTVDERIEIRCERPVSHPLECELVDGA